MNQLLLFVPTLKVTAIPYICLNLKEKRQGISYSKVIFHNDCKHLSYLLKDSIEFLSLFCFVTRMRQDKLIK